MNKNANFISLHHRWLGLRQITQKHYFRAVRGGESFTKALWCSVSIQSLSTGWITQRNHQMVWKKMQRKSLKRRKTSERDKLWSAVVYSQISAGFHSWSWGWVEPWWCTCIRPGSSGSAAGTAQTCPPTIRTQRWCGGGEGRNNTQPVSYTRKHTYCCHHFDQQCNHLRNWEC